jgi:hypothetical protein
VNDSAAEVARIKGVALIFAVILLCLTAFVVADKFNQNDCTTSMTETAFSRDGSGNGSFTRETVTECK